MTGPNLYSWESIVLSRNLADSQTSSMEPIAAGRKRRQFSLTPRVKVQLEGARFPRMVVRALVVGIISGVNRAVGVTCFRRMCGQTHVNGGSAGMGARIVSFWQTSVIGWITRVVVQNPFATIRPKGRSSVVIVSRNCWSVWPNDPVGAASSVGTDLNAGV